MGSLRLFSVDIQNRSDPYRLRKLFALRASNTTPAANRRLIAEPATGESNWLIFFRNAHKFAVRFARQPLADPQRRTSQPVGLRYRNIFGFEGLYLGAVANARRHRPG